MGKGHSGPFWGHFGETFGDNFWATLGPFGGHFWDIWGHSLILGRGLRGLVDVPVGSQLLIQENSRLRGPIPNSSGAVGGHDRPSPAGSPEPAGKSGINTGKSGMEGRGVGTGINTGKIGKNARKSGMGVGK